MAKKRLGKGLKALIPDASSDAASESVRESIRIDEISPNPYQPRKRVDEEKLDELAQSIKHHGIIQPVVLRKIENRFELVVGHRRWLAAQRLEMKSVPAIVVDLTDVEMMELALIENLQREDLDPVEEAEAYKRLLVDFGLTQEDVSDVVGKSRSAVANSLRLLNLPSQILKNVSRGTISVGHARCLLTLEGDKQSYLHDEMVRTGMSVREAEVKARRLREDDDIADAKENTKSTSDVYDPILEEFEENLSKAFGTKVNIKSGRKKGKIEIEYYSKDDLDRILKVIL